MLNIDNIPADPKMMGLQDPVAAQRHPNQGKVNAQNSHALQGVDFSSGTITPAQTQKILNQELVTKLEKRFGEEGVELAGLKAEDFTPRRVADNILSFVELGLSQVDGDEKKKERLEQAREAINGAFKEAREILDSIGVLSGKVKEDVDQTYDFIQIGLDQLASPEEKKAKKQETDEKLARINEGRISAGIEESRNTAVEITTADGDTVTIDLFKSNSESSDQSYSTDGNSSTYSSSSSSSSYSSIEYTVNGDLDEGEKAAIDDLLKQLGGVAKDFYQGNLGEAFDKARDVGFDTKELANFSVDMTHSQSSAVALSSYENVQRDQQAQEKENASLAEDNRHERPFVREAAEFMGQIKQLMKHNAMEFFANTEKSMADILNASISLQDKRVDQEDNKAKEPKNTSLNDIVAAAHNSKLTNAPEA